MKRVVTFFSLPLVLLCLTVGPALSAEQFPARPAQASAPAVKPEPAAVASPNVYRGYVPPAPIRHTWPGGYRVIIHEVANTFVEHLLGQY